VIDWTLFHFLNGSLRGHGLIGDEIGDYEGWIVPLFAAATILLWFLDRPGARHRWKTTALAALTAAGLGLLIAQPIAHLVHRPRPYVAHPGQTVLLISRSSDPSFPSDHAIAAFAIAVVVAVTNRWLGAAFLAAATSIALGRVFVGVHYPGDVLAGAAIGALAALLVVWLAWNRFEPIVRLLERISDPIVRPGWQWADRARLRRRARRSD